MAREHIKFIDSNQLPWEPIGTHGLRMRRLSCDTDTGAMTFVLDIPPGWKGGGVAHYHTCYEEAYVISGDVTLDGKRYYTANEYLYRPGYVVHGHDERSNEGCRALVKVGGHLDMNLVHEPESAEEYALPRAVFDRSLVQFQQRSDLQWVERGEGANHSRRQILSENPANGAVSTLVEFKPGWRGRAGAHYHSFSEEAYIISGDVALDDEPIYTAGCYLYRLRGIMHGPKERSSEGCLALIFQEEGPLDFNYAKDMADPHQVPWE
jgi:quercetin dioxygenase-like cupin family protein